MDEEYQAVRTTRLYEKIVEQIENRIIAGDLKVGDILPPERLLADRFGVSRTAVREAVKALSEKGLVEVRPGRGTYITDGTSQAVRQSLGRMVKIGQENGTRNLVEVREIFEPEIAALAALRAEPEQIDRLKQAAAKMDDAINDAEPFIEADLDFHLALADATQNNLIPTLITPIVGLLREQRLKIFHTHGGPEHGQAHHKRILEAVIRRDPDGARQAMQEHLIQVRKDSEG